MDGKVTRHGKVKESNTRTALTIDRGLYAEAKEIAAAEGISFNAMVVRLISQHVQSGQQSR